MQPVQKNRATPDESFSTATSTGAKSSRATTVSSQTSFELYNAVPNKTPNRDFNTMPTQGIAPIILQMPLQTVTGFGKPLQIKIFVGLGTAREYVASVEVALLKRFCSNFEECSQKTASGSSVLVERADRQTMGWFLRWLSQGQEDPIEPKDGDIDEKLRVCLARLYVFQRLGVILPSGKPEDTLMAEIEQLVSAMERLLSIHVKYVYEHFSDTRSVDYGQMFAAMIARATLNGSMHGMKDKTYWKSPPFVLFEKNMRAYLLGQELLARVERIQTFKPIPTDLLAFLLRFSTQGDQLRGTLAKDLVQLEQAHKAVDADAHYGEMLLNTGFKADLETARDVWAKAHQATTNMQRSRAKSRNVDKSEKHMSDTKERSGFVGSSTEHYKTWGQKQKILPGGLGDKYTNALRRLHREKTSTGGTAKQKLPKDHLEPVMNVSRAVGEVPPMNIETGSDSLGDKFANALRRLHREKTRVDEAAKQQLTTNQPGLVVNISRTDEVVPSKNLAQASYGEEQKAVRPETQTNPTMMVYPFDAGAPAYQKPDELPITLDNVPVMDAPFPQTQQPPKPRIIVRLPPITIAEKKHMQSSKTDTRCKSAGALNAVGMAIDPSNSTQRSSRESGREEPADTEVEMPCQTAKAVPIRPAIPLSFETKRQ